MKNSSSVRTSGIKTMGRVSSSAVQLTNLPADEPGLDFPFSSTWHFEFGHRVHQKVSPAADSFLWSTCFSHVKH